MSRPPNYEFQEWWNKQRAEDHFCASTSEDFRFLTVDIHNPTSTVAAAEKDRSRSSRQLSWVYLLKLHQIANSLAFITNGFVSLIRTANHRISNASGERRSASKFYRIIKFFLILSVSLLFIELVEYICAKWLVIRANYLGPLLQTVTTVCIVLFLIQSLGRLVLVLGCFYIKVRGLKPVAEMDYTQDAENGAVNAEDYPMVLVQIPMCNEREITMPNLGNSVAITPPLASLSGDPGFAERAAKFSCFGSRSFNDRSSPLGLNNGELGHRSSNLLMGNGKLSRVSSTSSLKQTENKNLSRSEMEIRPENGNKLSNPTDESSVSEQIPSGETDSKTSNEVNSRKQKADSRKRKAVSRGKSTPAKGVEGDEDGNAKQSKPQESGKNEIKTEEEARGGSNDESNKQKTNQKPPEPPKDYIHVRARRGQATDSHSLAERVRREKINARMKLLQDLVPGCNKVTGKAPMLDEIINHVQSLQRQVEFLTMKLASVNPGLDFNMGNLLSKDMFQQNTTLPQQMYPLDSSTTPAFYHQNTQQNNSNISGSPSSQCPVSNPTANKKVEP